MDKRVENSLVLFTKAAQMLAEADTIQKAKELKDLALTAADWAKRKDMGEEAIKYARSYALEAERKMGQMLTETELQHGARGIGKSGVTSSNSTPQRGSVVTPPTLAELGLTKRDSANAQKLAALPQETFEAIKVGEKTLAQTLKPHVSFNSGENEWYTPPAYIEAAREVMGTIDTDPASSAAANKIVKAGQFFSTEKDGLSREWSGNVWMNPPYAQPLITQFAQAITAKYIQGEIQQACILVNNATETEWFQTMLKEAKAICFIKGRIKYLDSQLEPRNTPLQGQVILYMGDNLDSFCEVFSGMGVTWAKM